MSGDECTRCLRPCHLGGRRDCSHREQYLLENNDQNRGLKDDEEGELFSTKHRTYHPKICTALNTDLIYTRMLIDVRVAEVG